MGELGVSTTSEGEPEMDEYTQEIAKIERTTLGYEDHGICTVFLHLSFGSSGQGAGGYALDEYDPSVKRRIGTAYGMEFIIRTLRACGVDEWSKLKGLTIYALRKKDEPHQVAGIEPLPTEKGERFIFAELGAAFMESATA
jgi:hypothetical protein